MVPFSNCSFSLPGAVENLRHAESYQKDHKTGVRTSQTAAGLLGAQMWRGVDVMRRFFYVGVYLSRAAAPHEKLPVNKQAKQKTNNTSRTEKNRSLFFVPMVSLL